MFFYDPLACPRTISSFNKIQILEGILLISKNKMARTSGSKEQQTWSYCCKTEIMNDTVYESALLPLFVEFQDQGILTTFSHSYPIRHPALLQEFVWTHSCTNNNTFYRLGNWDKYHGRRISLRKNS